MPAQAAGFDYTALRDRWYAEGWYTSRTCIDAFVRAAVEHPHKPVVFVAEGNEITVTVSEIHQAALAAAAGMQRLGIKAGDAVAVQLTNRFECAVAYQAVLMCWGGAGSDRARLRSQRGEVHPRGITGQHAHHACQVPIDRIPGKSCRIFGASHPGPCGCRGRG